MDDAARTRTRRHRARQRRRQRSTRTLPSLPLLVLVAATVGAAAGWAWVVTGTNGQPAIAPGADADVATAPRPDASAATSPGRPPSPSGVEAGGARQAADPMAPGTGRLEVVPAPAASATAAADPLRYVVEVEEGLPVSAPEFAAHVDAVLADERSWAAQAGRTTRRVAGGEVAFRVTLASAATTDELCAPLQTLQRWSCHQGGRAVINFRRWTAGVPHYEQAGLPAYRIYVLNHEVGHALGHGHVECPGAGRPAPVMMQQSFGLGTCRPAWWPAGSG